MTRRLADLREGVLRWLSNRGRNGWDPPVEVGPDRSVESRNVYLYKGGLGTRRGGAVSVTITGVTAPILGIFEYIQTALASAELWLVDSSAPTKILRCAGGPSFTNETLKDNISGNAISVSTAVLNSKQYFAYQSGVNRIHVYDPNNASTDTVRRGGLKAFGAAPTVADTGAGSYAATLRYYRTRSVEQQSSVTIRRSEPSASVSFTPSGSGTAARITRPTAISEGETHWEVEISTDNVTFYQVNASSPTAIATTTYDDTTVTTTISTTLTAAPPAGTYVPFPSVKCLGSTGTRLYGFGVWETSAGDSVAPKNGRLYFTPVLDTTTTHDDERISNTTTIQGFIDAARNAGGIDRGCSPRPVNNVIFCFQDRGVYAFYPTESNTTAYRRVVVSTAVGNLAQQGIVVAVDRNGGTACYFWDPVLGPYTVGGTAHGLKWCGKDVADIVATVNRDATTVAVTGEWYPDRSQIIWLAATNGANSPNFAVVLDPTKMQEDETGDLRGGWTTYDGDWVTANCIRTFSTTLAATRSSTRTPYTGTATKFLRYDETVFRDDATNFQAYVKSGSLVLDFFSKLLKRLYLLSSANSAAVRMSLIRNTGDETRTFDATPTPAASEPIVLTKYGDAAGQDICGLQIQVGDSAAQNANFGTLHQVWAEYESGAEL